MTAINPSKKSIEPITSIMSPAKPTHPLHAREPAIHYLQFDVKSKIHYLKRGVKLNNTGRLQFRLASRRARHAPTFEHGQPVRRSRSAATRSGLHLLQPWKCGDVACIPGFAKPGGAQVPVRADLAQSTARRSWRRSSTDGRPQNQ